MERRPVKEADPTVQARGKEGWILPDTNMLLVRLEILCARIQTSQHRDQVGYYIYPYFIDEKMEKQGG